MDHDKERHVDEEVDESNGGESVQPVDHGALVLETHSAHAQDHRQLIDRDAVRVQVRAAFPQPLPSQTTLRSYSYLEKQTMFKQVAPRLS